MWYSWNMWRMGPDMCKWYPEWFFIIIDIHMSVGAGVLSTQVWVCSVHCLLCVCGVSARGKVRCSSHWSATCTLVRFEPVFTAPKIVLVVTFPIVFSHSAFCFPFASSH